MQAYTQVTAAQAAAVLAEGWEVLARRWAATHLILTSFPVGAKDSFHPYEGFALRVGEEVCDTTFYLVASEEMFEHFEVTTELEAATGYHVARIPAGMFDRLDHSPQVYDHFLTPLSRHAMLRCLRDGQADLERSYPRVQDVRDAIALLDRVGWLAPLRVQKETGNWPWPELDAGQ